MLNDEDEIERLHTALAAAEDGQKHTELVLASTEAACKRLESQLSAAEQKVQTLERLHGCECVDPGSPKFANTSAEYKASVEAGFAGHVEDCDIGEYYRLEYQLRAAKREADATNEVTEASIRRLTDQLTAANERAETTEATT